MEWDKYRLPPPHDKDEVARIIAHIRNNATGEVRLDPHNIHFYDDGEPGTYIWEEGNFSCDCNRELFFARAGDEDDDLDGPCGDQERFSVNLENALTHEIFYREF